VGCGSSSSVASCSEGASRAFGWRPPWDRSRGSPTGHLGQVGPVSPMCGRSAAPPCFGGVRAARGDRHQLLQRYPALPWGLRPESYGGSAVFRRGVDQPGPRRSPRGPMIVSASESVEGVEHDSQTSSPPRAPIESSAEAGLFFGDPRRNLRSAPGRPGLLPVRSVELLEVVRVVDRPSASGAPPPFEQRASLSSPAGAPLTEPGVGPCRGPAVCVFLRSPPRADACAPQPGPAIPSGPAVRSSRRERRALRGPFVCSTPERAAHEP